MAAAYEENATLAQVFEVAACEISVADDASWPFVEAHAAEIDRHWQATTRHNQQFFDGIVLLTSRFEVRAGVLEIDLFRTRFRNYLYWRHCGFAGEGVIDGFGTALIHSADGAVVLIRQQAGNVNEGLYYTPSGFIDEGDVDRQGRVDIVASIAREIEEETGLGAGSLQRRPGCLVARSGAQLAIGVRFDSALAAEDLGRSIRAAIAAQERPELAEVRLVRSLADAADITIAPHTALHLRALLG